MELATVPTTTTTIRPAYPRLSARSREPSTAGRPIDALPSLKIGSATQTIHVATTADSATTWNGVCTTPGSDGSPATIPTAPTIAMPTVMIARAEAPSG